MRHFAGLVAIAVAVTGLGCGGSGGGEPAGPLPSVLFVRESGSDANTGETADDAFRTISRALQGAVGGQMIVVGPGEYRPSDTGAVEVEDIAGEPLLILADRSGSMTNDRAGEVVLDARNDNFGFRVSRASNVTIQGFRIERARGGENNAAIQVRSNSSNITIRDCEFSTNRDAIRVQNSTNVTIFNNLFFTNNRAIRLTDAIGVELLHNTIVDSGDSGISIGGASSTIFARNNILQDNSNRNIEFSPVDLADSYNGDFNLIFATRRNVDPEDTVVPSTIIGANAVLADASFVNFAREDFRLVTEAGNRSPAIDAGDNIGSLSLPLFELSATDDGSKDTGRLDLGYHFP